MDTLRTCPICGKVFPVSRKHPNKRFCSQKCNGKNHEKRVQRLCPICNKSFTRTPSDKRRFCSRKCANRSHIKDPAKRTIFTCKFCGKEFETWTYRNPSFCSMHCVSKYAARQPKLRLQKPSIHVTLQCVVCGKDYKTTTHQIRERGSSCCSRECVYKLISQRRKGENNPNYRGGSIRYRGANWGKQSRAAMKRDGYRCQICFKKISRVKWDYGIHHIKPYRDFNGDYISANALSNLITLCRPCHAKVEWGTLPCPVPLI